MGIIDFVKGIFIALFGLLLAISLFSFVVTTTIKSTILEPSFYYTNLEKTNSYPVIKEILVEGMVSNFEQQMRGMQSKNEQSAEEIQQLKTDLKNELLKEIPTDWVKTQLNNLIKNVMSYLKGETNNINLKIDIKEIKPKISTAFENFGTKILTAKMEKEFESMPQNLSLNLSNFLNLSIAAKCQTIDECVAYCTQQINADPSTVEANECKQLFLAALQSQELAGGEQINQTIKTMVSSIVKQEIEKTMAQIPDTIDINEVSKGEAQKFLTNTKENVIAPLSFVTNISMLAVAIFAILIILLTLSVKSITRHLGWPILLCGFSLIGISSIISNANLNLNIEGIPPQFMSIFLAIFNAFFEALNFNGIIVAIVGAALLIFSFLVKK